MKVLVDGTSLDLKEGATLGDALSLAGTKPAVGAIVGIVKGRGEKSLQTNSYWLNTTKGKIRIELLDHRSSEDLARIAWTRSKIPRYDGHLPTL